MINENDQNNVIFYGPDEAINISPIEPKDTPEDKQGKRVEGGYFTIQNS